MTQDTHPAPGWYGKLSPLGDFASRRLDADWIRSCDDWLSRCIAASREQLADAWLNTYLAAPVWRFAWAPGVVDERWWFGVLMPSCDNVGRYFPLIVTQPRERPPVDRIGLDHLDLWWRHVARASVQTLHDQGSLDEFEAQLAAAPPWPSSALCATHGEPLVAAGHARRVVAPGQALVDWSGLWASAMLLKRVEGCSIWWPMADAGEAGSVTVSPGLPEPERFVDLLSWRW